jgi:hypothetical protein
MTAVPSGFAQSAIVPMRQECCSRARAFGTVAVVAYLMLASGVLDPAMLARDLPYATIIGHIVAGGASLHFAGGIIRGVFGGNFTDLGHILSRGIVSSRCHFSTLSTGPPPGPAG